MGKPFGTNVPPCSRELRSLMKIATISSGFLPVIDGVTVSLDRRARCLAARGHEVLILCPDYRSLAAIYPHWQDWIGEIYPRVRVVGLPSESFMGVEFERNLGRAAKARLQQELQAFEPDIVHVDEPDRIFLGLWTAPGVAYGRAQGIPCTGFYHTNFIDYIEDFFPLPGPAIAAIQWGSAQVMRRVFHAYDATLVSSPSARDRIERMGVRNIICDRFLGIDLDAFVPQLQDPHFFQTQYGIDDLQTRVKLVFVGRLTPDKGWGFTLQALQEGVKNQPTWRDRLAILIAGDGEMRGKIERMRQAIGFPIHLLGRIPPAEIPALLFNSDIHITASEKETLGLTVLEAFAAGIPAIAPRAGGVVTLIRDGENGLLFTPRDRDSFEQAIARLVENAPLRRKMGQQGRQDAVSYGEEAAVTRLLETWQAQLARQKAL
ncbi:glycosyltransferase [Spirulina sp. 06S082]|uniref:glycosyltransferase n=1 Tax=Spirulina sp. 06S082 TaxID=3110248 RepID=UPI002B20BA28|nr:glycosyltransferase [Spirulina sp. 06S082]MEA5471091.1 glycosyltransferase [Spirulina sp. 06S082]